MSISIIKELTGVLVKNIDESNIKEKEIELARKHLDSRLKRV